MTKHAQKLFLATLMTGCLCVTSDHAADGETVVIFKPESSKKTTPSDQKNKPYKKTPTPLSKSGDGQKIWFKFKDEPLSGLVNYVAHAKNMNIVLPGQGQDPAFFAAKISYEFPDKITVAQAYEKMLSILKIEGYLFIPQGEFYYVTKGGGADSNQQTYPLYINTPPADLPDSDQMIRYVYYFTNIQVPASDTAVGGGQGGFGGGFGAGGSGSTGQALQNFLNDALPKNTYLVDPSLNGLILTNYARNIRSIMEIVKEIDSYGFTDTVEMMPLEYTSAATISDLLMNKLINAASGVSGAGAQGGFTQPVASQAAPSSAAYFAPSTKIVCEPRSNSLIIMGKNDAVNRVREFVKKYIDVPLDSGDSILHIYPLQYLKAADFAPLLQGIVSAQSGNSSVGGGNFGGSTGQSSGTSTTSSGKQYFKGVIVQAEVTAPAQPAQSSSSTGSSSAPAAAQQGGNRLMIAAVHEDWLRIKKLINDLDRPQPQVALEMLIVDFTLTGNRALGSQVRNKQGMLPVGVDAQTSMLGPLVLTNPSNPTWNALMANLLQLDANENNLATSQGTASNGTNIPVPAGTFILSLQDNATTGIAWVMQALASYTDTKILSHPFTVVLNKQPTQFVDNETRLLPGSATVKKGATITPIDPVTAALQIDITPMINGDDYVNLGINVQIAEFSTGNSQINRQIVTNANVKDGQVLVLGGLTKTTISTLDLGTPGLEKIPFIGWLFKNKTKGVLKSNLAVFICPRILQSTDGYCDPFTAEKFGAATKAVSTENNFSTLRDPITRWFFGTGTESSNEKTVSDYINRKQFNEEKMYHKLLTNPKMSKLSQESAESVKKFLPPPPPPPAKPATVKKNNPPAAVKVANSNHPAKETIILSKNDTREQEELKRLFASFNSTDSMHDSATRMKANLL